MMKLHDRSHGDSETSYDQGSASGQVLGAGYSASLLVGILLTIVVIVAAVQNTEDAHLEFLAWDANAPLVAILLAAVLVGVVFDEIVGLLWRHRRRHQISMKEELARHRAALSQGAASDDLDEPSSNVEST